MTSQKKSHCAKPLYNLLVIGFLQKKSTVWARQENWDIVGGKLSSVCYIDQAFPAALYLAWKYHNDSEAAIIANAKVGGDICHRAAVVGALVAISQPEKVANWTANLHDL